jgi:hypothetical protein
MFKNIRKKFTINWGRKVSSNTQNLLAEAPQLNRQTDLKFRFPQQKMKIQVQFSSTLWTAAESSPFRPDQIKAQTEFWNLSKVKLSRYTPWRHMRWEEVQLLLILNLSTRWGWVVSVTPRPRFTPGEKTPGTHWIAGWVGPRAGLDARARRKILCPCRGSNPGRPFRSQTLYRLSYRGSYFVI